MTNTINQTLDTILNRKSIRAYTEKPIEPEVKDQILKATLRSPTAGNLMLYSIIEVTQQKTKDKLAITCDNQPFIAKAPFVLLFLADYQRWIDYYEASDIETFCKEQKLPKRMPDKGDLFLACCDALIAAQTSVIAAESLGLGSCYIGDIMENYETHKEIFNLPSHVFPITMVCYGYPTKLQKNRELTQRFASEYICFKDTYKRFNKNDFNTMFEQRQKQVFGKRKTIKGAENMAQYMYQKKYAAAFTTEMNRSVNKMVDAWLLQ
jgi:nitroreductase